MIRYGRIQLRKPESQEDHHLQVEWRNGDLARQFFYSEDEVTLENHMRWHEKMVADPNQRFFMIDALTEPPPSQRLLPQPLPIGTTSLLKIDSRHRTAEYGRLLIGRADYQRGGFASEAEYALMAFAFNHLGLNRVYGEVLPDNQAVRRLHRKFGFREEGTLRQHILKGGAFRDVIIVGLLSTEFAAIQPSGSGKVEIHDERP